MFECWGAVAVGLLWVWAGMAGKDEADFVLKTLLEASQIVSRLSEKDVDRTAVEKLEGDPVAASVHEARIKDWGRATALLMESEKTVKIISDLADLAGKKLELTKLQMETWKIRAEDSG